MDPLSQGIVGAAAAGIAATLAHRPPRFLRRVHPSLAPPSSTTTPKPYHLRIAILLGFLAALSPDLDVFIHSDTDPLLGIEYHRHFTHALLFIPLGALLAAALLHLVVRRYHLTFKQTYWYCFSGYATHGLLDACTTYGTYLFWPLTDARISWRIIGIVDPLFTLPIVFLIIAAVIIKSRRLTAAAAIWGVLYLTLGGIQHHRAETAAHALAQTRGHTAQHLAVVPSLGSLLLWRSIYQHQDIYYVDGVRTGLRTAVWRGECVEKYSRARHTPWIDPASQQYTDIQRFRHFANGYIAPSKHVENVVVDMRYAMLPHSTNSLWGIRLSPTKTPTQHADYFQEHPDSQAEINAFLALLKGKIPTQPSTPTPYPNCTGV